MQRQRLIVYNFTVLKVRTVEKIVKYVRKNIGHHLKNLKVYQKDSSSE